MMKKLISLVLAFVLCVSLVPASAFAEDEVPEENAIEESSVEEVEMVDSIVEDEETEVVEQEILGIESGEKKTAESGLEEGEEISEEEALVEETEDISFTDGAGTYSINGKTVSYTDFSSSPSECWAYANNLYYKIWGSNFTYEFSDSSNMLRNLSDSDLTLTESHLREYVSSAVLGSSLRICNSEYLHGTDGWGHSQIIVQKDTNGFTVLEGGLSSSPYCREKYYTWSEYINTSWLGGTYQYIKYIKWPGASAYSVDSTPTACLDVAEGGTGTIHLRGWAFDKDITSKQVGIRVYSNGTLIYDGVANTYRDDVNEVYSCGNYHGFDFTFNTTLSGNVPITVYVLNYNKDGNYDDSKNLTLCSDRIVTVKKSVDINYYDSDGEVWKTETSNADKFTLSAEYPKESGSYFCGWSYTSGGTTIDARPGDTITVSANVNLYPIFVTHEEAISGKAVPIYNIEDFTTSGYTATQADVTWTTTVDNSYWSDWSEYSTTAVSASSTVQVRTTTMYRYYYFYCPSCGGHEPFQGASDCHNYTLSSSDAVTKFFTTPYKDSNYQSFSYTSDKYYTESLGDGQRWCFSAGNLNDTAVGTVDTDSAATVITTGYSSRTWIEKKSEQKHTVSGYIITQSTPVTYTVTYDATYGTGAPEAQTKTHNVDLVLSETEPTWGGFIFLGWATDTNPSSQVKYLPGDTYAANADMTLYARWKAETYSVKYDANGGTGAPSEATKIFSVPLTLSATEPTRDGYTFLGWATTNTAITATYQAGASYKDNADITLYAVWQENAPVSPSDAPTITTESKTVCPGQSFTVTVSVANNPGIMAMILTPVYDANVMTLDSVDNGTVFSAAPEQGKNLTWLGDVDTDQNGMLLTYHFTVKEDAAEGNYTVGVSSVTSSDEDETPVTFTVTNGTVTVKSIVYGDATGDGEVNIFDLVRLKKYLANYDSDTQTSTIAISGGGDATGNGTIDIFDLVRLKKYLANYDADTKTSTVALGPTV